MKKNSSASDKDGERNFPLSPSKTRTHPSVLKMDIEIKIELPALWKGEFVKTTWNSVNFIVGANGTGKTLFSEKLKQQLANKGYRVRTLTAERLAGFERSNYAYFSSSGISSGLNISQFSEYKDYGNQYGLSTPAFILLKQRLDIRIRIETILSDLFKKNIRLVEEGGFLKPKMQNINGGEEYSLKEQECHGLKEIISLLTFLYDDEYNCLIFDEPELHLHPQFQSFFLSEIRKLAGDPNQSSSKKLFFIITHSPYFLDVQNLDDLSSILVCHNGQMPTYIKDGDLEDQDKYVLLRFLPRFNTHHKQFFFSPNPVFVEGYTDQQIITLLFEKTGMNIAASGSSVIDVGGKEELAVFYRLCQKLSIDCRIIADYDALLRGKLRECFCANKAVKDGFVEKGYGIDPSNCIGSLESTFLAIGDELSNATCTDADINHLLNHLKVLYADRAHNLDSIKDAVLLSIVRFPEKIKNLIPAKAADVNLARTRIYGYIACIKAANIFIIPTGELEHFFIASSVDYLKIQNKDKLFHTERDHILNLSGKDISTLYADILGFLKESIPFVNVDLLKHMRFTVIDFIQKVQIAVEKGDVSNLETLKNNGNVDYATYSQILECRDADFKVSVDKKFICKVYLKAEILGEEKLIEFTDTTTAREFQFN